MQCLTQPGAPSRTFALVVGIGLATLGPGSAPAQPGGSAAARVTPQASSAASAPARHVSRDPAPPAPSSRHPAQPGQRALQATTGATLTAQVEQQLRSSFDSADRAHRGKLTAAEARAGGFGYVALHFDAIDARHAGEVTFDDLERYLQLHGAPSIAK